MHSAATCRLSRTKWGYFRPPSHQLFHRSCVERTRKPIHRHLLLCCAVGSDGTDSVRDRLEAAAASGKGLTIEEVQQLLELSKRGGKEGTATDAKQGKSEEVEEGKRPRQRLPKFPGGIAPKDWEIPERIQKVLKDAKIWDKIPPEGLRYDDSDDNEDYGFWTKEEYDILMDKDFEGSEEEEARREVIKYEAIEKLANKLREYANDPEKIINMGYRTECALKVKRFVDYKVSFEEIAKRFRRKVVEDDEYYWTDEEYDDSPKTDKYPRNPDVDRFLHLLAQGKRMPPATTWNKNLLPPEDAESFVKRITMMKNYFHDEEVCKEDRILPEEEFKAIQRRWEEFSKEFDEAEDPVFPEDVQVSQSAPDFPEWMDQLDHTVQHMLFLLRSAHIEGTITEPARRLHKYDLLTDDVKVKISSVLETTGFDAYWDHLLKIRSAGVTTEMCQIFQAIHPTSETTATEETPPEYEITVDHYVNVPLPEWYQKLIAKQDEKMKEEREKKSNDGKWRNPLDISEYRDQWSNRVNLNLLQSMDEAVKSKCEEPPEPPSPAATWQIGDEDPYPDEGPIWLKEEPQGNAWKKGDLVTFNTSATYMVDSKAKKIKEIEVKWGAMVGAINSMEDGEKMYRLAAGLDPTVATGDYKSFQSLVYDAFFKNPVEWVKQVFMDRNLKAKMKGKMK